MRPRARRLFPLACLLALAVTFGTAQGVSFGGDVQLDIEPGEILLDGRRSSQRLAVTLRTAGGDLVDVGRVVEYSSSDPAIVDVLAGGVLVPRGDGHATIAVRYIAAVDGAAADGSAAGGGRVETSVVVQVKNFLERDPVSFRHTVMAVLGKHGCNAGACHGSPKGKNGFRLSLRGYDPDVDFKYLTREAVARRTNALDPDVSLMLLKALGQVPHQGGKRFARDSRDHGILRDWIVEGLKDDKASVPDLVRLEAFPRRRALRPPADAQQLVITAHFADGTRSDVTDLCVYTSNDEEVVEVDAEGLVARKAKGEAAVLVRYLDKMATARLTFLPPASADEFTYPKPKNYIDGFAYEKLRLLGIPASPEAADEEFLRRVYLDTVALLPTSEEVREFLADKRPDKRVRLIDRLLERPEFDDYWSMKWLDVLGSSRKNLGTSAVHRFQRWVRQSIAARMPLDEMARRIITAKGDVNQNPAANFYRVADKSNVRAEIAAQIFLGVRMECAQCHNHPFEKWTQNDYYGMAAFFAGVRVKGPGPKAGGNNSGVKDDRQVVWFDVQAPKQKHLATGKLIDPRAFGDTVPAPEGGDGSAQVLDPRVGLAAWLTSADNPFFAPTLANRIWYHLFGRGIVDPVDDFRDSNPPSNDELLSALVKDLQKNRYDLRHLVRTILNSGTYQRSSRTVEGNENDVKYFSHSVPRLLGAEQLLDALCQVSSVPESYPGFPAGTRAVQLPDPGVDNGFLTAFGKPQRNIACECEREGDGATISQALEMVRGDTVHKKIGSDKNRLAALLAGDLKDEKIVEELYLSAVSRFPREAERKAALEFIAKSESRRPGYEDLLWALFNSKEFLFRR